MSNLVSTKKIGNPHAWYHNQIIKHYVGLFDSTEVFKDISIGYALSNAYLFDYNEQISIRRYRLLNYFYKKYRSK